MDMDFERENLAFAEKISLAKLEEAKASERVRELEYQRDRYRLDYFLLAARQAQQQAQAQQQQKAV